jgi:DNA-binding response OmpR family regulator
MEPKIKILLAEDDINLGALLKEYLNAKNYHTDLYENGELAYKAFMNQHYDACIFDVMMPLKDGFTLAKEVRAVNSEIPVLFLTAKSMKDDIFEGFSLGADDYITKPFSMQELLLRLEAILRRTKKIGSAASQTTYQIGKYQFDAQKQILKLDDYEEKLTTKESELLRLLAQNVNSVLERNHALKTIWIEDNYFNARSMDVYITKLRKHLKDDENVQILNVHGKGYKLITE